MLTCSKCGLKKPEKDFYKRSNKKRGFSYSCIVCDKKYHREYYKKDRENSIIRSKRTRYKIKTKLDLLKVETGCKICGFNKSSFALDYHHIDPATKLDSIGNLYHNSSKKSLDEEIKKCVLLCANCHRMVHSGEINIE